MLLPLFNVTTPAWLTASAYSVTAITLQLMLTYTSFSSIEMSGGDNG